MLRIPPVEHELLVSFFLKKDFIYLFLERGEGKEKERERNINVWLPLKRFLLGIWPATQACALTGNRTGDPLVCRPTLNPTEPLQPGLSFYKEKVTCLINFPTKFGNIFWAIYGKMHIKVI